ncbi:MAG: hypothetical protein QOJ79_3493 [Actinomycetota bacterium]|jgi:hypothetical protein|nr:hypothetical protein [Actinomycetota bacterium]
MTDEWAGATYAGNQRAQRRRQAALTPQQRLAWLEEALTYAARSGGLARVRQRKQRDVLEAWHRGSARD